MLWFLNAYVFLTKLKKHRFIVRNQMFFIRFDMGDNSVSETLVTFGLNFSRPRCHFESYSNLAIVAFKFGDCHITILNLKYIFKFLKNNNEFQIIFCNFAIYLQNKQNIK